MYWPELVARAIAPDYALGPHTSPLGLASSIGTTLPAPFANGMLIGQHGSWNRRPHSGYKVIFVPFEGGKPSGAPVDVLTGFLREEASAYGRPTGVALDKQGALLVADDVGNMIWRVSAGRQAQGWQAWHRCIYVIGQLCLTGCCRCRLSPEAAIHSPLCSLSH